MREDDAAYFRAIEARLDDAIAVANEARSRGGDPAEQVEIPVARDMADRVENILEIPGVADRVREMEADPELSREEAALELARDFATGAVGSFDTTAGKIEAAVRTAVALLTEGVVAAPIEGIDRVEIVPNDDGSEFVRVFYAGPIRSAGGTAQALSVLVADYTRTLLGVDQYKPRQEEVERYVEELKLYDGETGLQYSPSEAETRFIAQNVPIMLDGEPTGQEEVDGYRDLDRVETNAARGGMCLVLGEGIAQKAPKIERYTSSLTEVAWPWLDDLIDSSLATEGATPAQDETPANPAGPAEMTDPTAQPSGPVRPEPGTKFLRDLIAGRPVFGHPSRRGGFRLRYGRARNHGFATAGVHPATMHLVDDFLATGTQLKTERPGKAAGVVPVDSIEGPTVKLATGEVRRIDDPAEAKRLRNGVDAILDLGEYLVNYGEFVENNQPLAPASYTVEWWEQDLAHAGGDLQALSDDPRVSLARPSVTMAIELATEYDCPLHPEYTYLWHDLSVSALDSLADELTNGHWERADGTELATYSSDASLVLEPSETVPDALETLLVGHTQEPDRVVVPDALALVHSAGLTAALERTWTLEDLSAAARDWAAEAAPPGANAVRAVCEIAPFSIRERAPTRIGARMGRPEKSESRELSPAVHTLFPIGEAGGSQRDVTAAASWTADQQSPPGEVDVEIARRTCPACDEAGFQARCRACGAATEPAYRCRDCGVPATPDDAGRASCPRCGGVATAAEYKPVDLKGEYDRALSALSERAASFDILKGVKGLTSAEKLPEPIEKGILRAKHGVSTFKDGTVRYDMTDLPVTSVRPAELGVSVDRFRELGYDQDIDGEPLEHGDQLVELRVQDIVLSAGAATHMLRTANFVDDLLERYYGLEPFYELDQRQDLVGELVFGMAPHTSAAVVGRIVGFTSAAVGYAHPYFHAAKRRNCFHPETTVRYEASNGEIVAEPIGQFVERRLDSPREDDFGTLVQALSGSVRVPSITDEGTEQLQPVEAVSKHPAPDHLVRLEFDSGRSLRVTPDHRLLRLEAGATTAVEAATLEVGDRLARSTIGDQTPPAERLPVDGGISVSELVATSIVPADVEHTYCLTVAETHVLTAEGQLAANCDGDEDCVMLLMDGLLNFSKKFLPDQRGGSVAAHSRLVARDPAGRLRFLTFEEFWDALESPLEVDGRFRKRVCRAEGWQTYAFDERAGARLQPIETAIRYPAPAEEGLLRVETADGRSVEITADHSLFRYDDGIESVAGSALEAGDLILAPGRLPADTSTATLDCVALLENPSVVAADPRESQVTPAPSSPPEQPSAQVSSAVALSELPASEAAPIARDRAVTVPGETEGIDRQIPVSESFAWLVGLYTARGTLAGARPRLEDLDPTLAERVLERSAEAIGRRPSLRERPAAVTATFPAVLGRLFGAIDVLPPGSSAERTVPQPILEAPEPVVVAFLRGAEAGQPAGDAALTVEGERFKDGLVMLLHRLGRPPEVTPLESPGERATYSVAAPGDAGEGPLAGLDGEDGGPLDTEIPTPPALERLRALDVDEVAELLGPASASAERITRRRLAAILERAAELSLPEAATQALERLRPLADESLSFLAVSDVQQVAYDGYLYDLQVGGDPVFTTNWLFAHNSMDAPLVMSSRIDPTEIDDEAHNIDVDRRYPRSFYLQTLTMADPTEADIELAADTLGADSQYEGFGHTHDTSNIALGPALSAYKTLEDMQSKMDGQLQLARKLAAVDETDVAERIIEYHFLPDLIGNLRAFSRQKTRCHACGEDYRRMPLSGDCRACGEEVYLTVHQGSVNKYIETAMTVAEEFDCRPYTKQRLEVLRRSLESVFEDDTNRQSGIADFM